MIFSRALFLSMMVGCSSFGGTLSEGQIVSLPMQGSGFAGCSTSKNNRTLFQIIEKSGDYLKADSLYYSSRNGKGSLSKSSERSVVYEFNLANVSSYAICFESFEQYLRFREQ